MNSTLMSGAAGLSVAPPDEASPTVERIRQLLSREDAVILDTETTGHRHAEIIEISIINMAGDVLLNRLVRPRRMLMNSYAQKVHGISLGMLENEPTLPELLPELEPILSRSLMVAWNASFDKLMIQRSRAIWDLPPLEFRHCCAMRLYAGLHSRRDFGLQRALEANGLTHLLATHSSHRALGDAQLVLELLRSVADAELPDQASLP